MNPDPDFVLQGRPSSYWSKPGYLSNSELTTTTKGIGEYASSNYDDGKRMTRSLRSMSHQLNRVSSNLKESLLGNNTGGSYDQTYETPHTSSYNFDPESPDAAEWYTHPVHLSHTYTQKPSTILRPSRSVSPIGRNSEALGPVLRDELESRSRVCREMEYKKMANEDALAARYFPVTLGAAYYMQAADRSTGAPIPTSSKPSISKSGLRTSFSNMSNRQKRAKSAARVDEMLQDAKISNNRQNMKYLVSEAPTIASAVNVISMTPYQTELARLRMDRLRLEEDKLLELKRQEELERIRGPKPKWYEMKSPEFHYEAHKNNQLIRSRDKWDDLLQYREELQTASDDFNTSWASPIYA